MNMIETMGWLATGIALVGVWLNNRRRRACFALWLVSNALTFIIHAVAGIWPLAARDGVFFVLAIHGWWLWTSQRRRDTYYDARQSADSGT